jgi:hypothetical protein
MTTEDKAAKFDAMQLWLWNAARYGNVMQSAVAAAMIRELQIPSPEGDDPNDA